MANRRRKSILGLYVRVAKPMLRACCRPTSLLHNVLKPRRIGSYLSLPNCTVHTILTSILGLRLRQRQHRSQVRTQLVKRSGISCFYPTFLLTMLTLATGLRQFRLQVHKWPKAILSRLKLSPFLASDLASLLQRFFLREMVAK